MFASLFIVELYEEFSQQGISQDLLTRERIRLAEE